MRESILCVSRLEEISGLRRMLVHPYFHKLQFLMRRYALAGVRIEEDAIQFLFKLHPASSNVRTRVPKDATIVDIAREGTLVSLKANNPARAGSVSAGKKQMQKSRTGLKTRSHWIKTI